MIFRLKKIIFLSCIFSFFAVFQFVFAGVYQEIITVSTAGVAGNASSFSNADVRRNISADGRYVVFASTATNLVAGDSNGVADIFIRDTTLNTTERVSVSSLGVQSNGASTTPSVSDDGRYVAFESTATNLVASDGNGVSDIFVYDRDTDTIEIVSVDGSGNEGDAGSHLATISGNGRYVVFSSDADNIVTGLVTGFTDLFVYDRDTDTPEQITVNALGVEADNVTLYSSISADGRYVAFHSGATNLVPGYNSGTPQVYVKDRNTEAVDILSVDSVGVEGDSSSRYPFISGNGRFVAFESFAENLVVGDTNGVADIFLYDRNSDDLEHISHSYLGGATDGGSLNPSVSSDGNYVVFWSIATNIVTGDTEGDQDFFIHNRITNITSMLSAGNRYGIIASDGDYINFDINDGTVSGDTNGFVDIVLYALNSSPTDISLSSSSISESSDIGDLIGSLSTTDSDTGDTHTYSFACASAGVDDASFSISGSDLITAQTFDYETKLTYEICIRTDDGNNGTFDKDFTISITNESESTSSSGGGNSNPPPPPPTPNVFGCTNSSALNFNQNANVDNGSCLYNEVEVFGCTDPLALNFNSSATNDDSSCNYNPLPIPPEDPVTPEENPEENNEPNIPVENNINDVNSNGDIKDKSGNTLGVNIEDIPEDFANSVSGAGLVLPVIAFIVTQPAAAASIPVRFWNLIPTLIGLRRKKRPWGTVYDSVTKQPLDPVHITLQDLDGKEIATTITDIDGRFGFLVPPGKYTIKASKSDYEFPSKKMAGKTKDDLYENLYFNEVIEVREGEDLVVKNIPMDSISFNWNEFEKSKNKKLMKFYSKRDLFLAKIADISFYAGIIFSVVMMFKAPAPLNYVIFGVYLFVLVLRALGVRLKKPGHVIDIKTGEPVSYGIIKVYSTDLNREISRDIINKTGKYYTLVSNGQYYIKVDKKTGEDSYEEIFTSPSFKVRDGYIGKVLKV